MQIVISSGHAKDVRGASGYIDEVDEARLVVEEVATALRGAGVPTITYHDNISTSQSENLNRIVTFHNSKPRDWDVSVHFNATDPPPTGPVGCEVLYVSSTGETMAKKVVDAICTTSGLKNRGPKYRNNLAFLNNTNKPAILIEVCFVDSKADVEIYNEQFYNICYAIAGAISGKEVTRPDRPPVIDRPVTPEAEVLFHAIGKCSHFGGPKDMGVSPSEGLAFIYEVKQAPHLFLPYQPSGTTGLARRLDPEVYYIACRWDYEVTSKTALLNLRATVKAKKTGKEYTSVYPADWGPNENTGRVADLSPGLMKALGIETDDEVEVTVSQQEADV